MREQLDKLNNFLRDRDIAIDILRASGSADQKADGEGFYQECASRASALVLTRLMLTNCSSI
jgi:hypothetical protein